MSAWSTWSRVLLPILITLLVGGLGVASTALVRDATTRAQVEELDERRLDAAEERRRIAKLASSTRIARRSGYGWR